MAEILGLQDQDPEDTPNEEKASNVSWRWCPLGNSYVSVIACQSR